AIAMTLGVAWLTLVYITPPPPPTIALLRPEEAAAVEVEFEDEKPKPPPKPEETRPVPPPETEKAKAKAEAKAKKEEADAGNAFGGTGSSALVGDVTNALRGVEVSKGGSAAGTSGSGGGGKAVIAYGKGGTDVRTPGRGIDPSVAAAGANIGT